MKASPRLSIEWRVTKIRRMICESNFLAMPNSVFVKRIYCECIKKNATVTLYCASCAFRLLTDWGPAAFYRFLLLAAIPKGVVLFLQLLDFLLEANHIEREFLYLFE